MQDNNIAEEIELVLPDEEVTEEAQTEEVVEAAPEQKDELDDVSELPAIKWKQINLAKMPDDKHKLALDKLKEVLRV